MTSVFVKEPIAIICMLIYTLVDTLITVFFSYKVYKGEVKSSAMVEEMNKQRKVAVGAGLGYGEIEAIILIGLNYVNNLLYNMVIVFSIKKK